MKKENSKLIIWGVVALVVGFIIGMVLTNVTIGNAARSIVSGHTVLVKNVDEENTPCGLCYYTSTWYDGTPVQAIAECYTGPQGVCVSGSSECHSGCRSIGVHSVK